MEEIESDVVVIGAGASGLSAADALVAQGFTVTVLEARDRVGGRLWTKEVDGVSLEFGGQWVSPDQTALIDMISDLGLETFSRYREGESVYLNGAGAVSRFTGDFPVAESTKREIQGLIDAVEELVLGIDVEAPWAHPQAAEYDSISWRDWLISQSDDEEARKIVSIFIADGMFTKPAHTISLLQALFMASSSETFHNLVDEDIVLDKRVLGGLQQVPQRLAARLGESVHLNQPVRRVAWSDDSVSVSTDTLTVHARKVVVAVPPNLYSRITFEPALPDLQQQFHQHLSLGLVIKVQAVYESAFWREDGLSGTAFGPDLALHEAYDNTHPGTDGGTLVGFVSDVKADAMTRLTPAQRREHLLGCLASYFGPRALTPIAYAESDWAGEEWTRGSYAASFDLGGLSRYGALLREQVGPISWSTSDLASVGYLHVDGAIRIGKDTADNIATQLRAQPNR